MKKCRLVGSPALILYTTLYGLPLCLLLFILFLANNNMGFAWFILVSYFVGFGVMALIYRNAFRVCELNHEGIQCKKDFVPWEAVDKIEVYEMKVFRYDLIPTKILPLICIGNIEPAPLTLVPQNCIFFPLSRKNLEKLREYSHGKSEAINEFLELYKERM